MRGLGALALLAAGCAGAAGPIARRHTEAPRLDVPREVLQFRWRRLLTEAPLIDYKPQEFASAASDGKRVFIGSRGGWFWALGRADGSLAWRKKVNGGVASRPLYHAAEGVVYVGGADGAMYALDGATGRERWVYHTKGPIDGEPVWDEGMLYFTNGENRVFCIDARTGAWRWQYDRETPESFTIRGVASPLVYGGRVYAGFADGYLAALNARNGDVIWARSLAGESTRFVDVDSTPVVAGGVLYAASYSGGVHALEPADGAVRWRYDVEGAGSVRVDPDRIYFSATRAGLHCLDLKGRLVWRQALAGQGELSTPTLVGDRLLMVSAAEGGTYIVDRPSGRLLQFFAPGVGITAPPSSDGQQVWVLTNGGFFYTFAL